MTNVSSKADENLTEINGLSEKNSPDKAGEGLLKGGPIDLDTSTPMH